MQLLLSFISSLVLLGCGITPVAIIVSFIIDRRLDNCQEMQTMRSLNNKYAKTTSAFDGVIDITHRDIRSVREWRYFNAKAWTEKYILEHRSLFINIIEDNITKRQEYREYLQEASGIINYANGPFLETKKKKLQKLVRQYHPNYDIILTYSYTSPAGRNHYESQYIYHWIDIVEFVLSYLIPAVPEKEKYTMPPSPITIPLPEPRYGCSVTARVKTIKQPRGGYLPPKAFQSIQIEDNQTLHEEENVHASIIGMAVDYLTRYKMGASIDEAFGISVAGATKAEMLGRTNAIKNIKTLLSGIKGLDDQSIICACKAVTYDVWYRNVSAAQNAKNADETNPDASTVNNIRIMVQRSVSFWRQYGPISKDGFTFETDGYSKVVTSGDGDFLTADTMWDFKVSKSPPTTQHTLQLLMYWIMGQHSRKEEFRGITKLGIYNPRINKVYLFEIKSIPIDTIRTVEQDIICY